MTSPQRPPGPWSLPLLGNLIRFRQQGLDMLCQGRQRYGDVVRYHMGPYPMVCLSHPDHARHVLRDHHEQYPKTGRATTETALLAGRSLLVANGERWRQTRRLMQPSFGLGQIAQYAPLMAECGMDVIQRWRSQGADQIDVAAEMMRVTYRIVGRAMLGDDLADTAEKVERAIEVTLAHLYRRIEGLALPLAWPTPGNRAFVRERDSLYALVEDILRRRQQRTGPPTNDLLAQLLEARAQDHSGDFDDTWLRDEIVTLMLAGHETTANALTWTWHLLGQHPDIAARVHAEATSLLSGRAPTFDELQQLPYTRQVLEEAMRLYPPIWAVERRAREADVIGGRTIAPGALVIVATYAMHRHPEFWEHPDRFDPGRFEAEQVAKRSHYVYLPFGSGPRLCIGMNFALSEAVLLLATLIQHCQLVPLPHTRAVPHPGITLRVKNGLPMRLVWR